MSGCSTFSTLKHILHTMNWQRGRVEGVVPMERHRLYNCNRLVEGGRRGMSTVEVEETM